MQGRTFHRANYRSAGAELDGILLNFFRVLYLTKLPRHIISDTAKRSLDNPIFAARLASFISFIIIFISDSS